MDAGQLDQINMSDLVKNPFLRTMRELVLFLMASTQHCSEATLD